MTVRDPASRRRPTMADVAAAAGVSLKTVSRVVNGNDYVAPEKAARVREVIAELAFRPNDGARRLRGGRTSTIGLVLEDAGDPFYSAMTRAVEDVALEHGYLLVSASSAEDPERARHLIETLGSRGIEGLIVAPAKTMDASALADELLTGTPLVLVDRPVDGVDVDTVLAENRGGARRGTELLLAHGHRRIAFFGDDASVYTAAERHAGFVEALAAAGVAPDPLLQVRRSPEETVDELPAILHRLLDSDDPPTALFSGNNRWSVRLLRALRARAAGERARLAFVGFDDFELADVLDPAISVVAQDPAEMGRMAATLLFRRLGGDEAPPQRVELPLRLIQRGSGELPR